MMGTRAWSVGVWALLGGGGVAVSAAAFGRLGGSAEALPIVSRPVSAELLAKPYPADSLRAVVVGRDLFRVERRPAAVAYDPVRLAQVTTAPPPTRPALLLSGIVFTPGGEAAAVIQGFPGMDGPRVVRRGEIVGGITLKAIAPGEVRLVGFDTTWILRLRQP